MNKHREDGEDSTFVMTRAEDRSNWLRISYALDKYKILVWAAMAVLVALGFGFKTPKQAIGEVSTKLDSATKVLNERMDRQQELLLQTQEGLNTLVRLRCLDITTSASRVLARAAGLQCGDK